MVWSVYCIYICIYRHIGTIVYTYNYTVTCDDNVVYCHLDSVLALRHSFEAATSGMQHHQQHNFPESITQHAQRTQLSIHETSDQSSPETKSVNPHNSRETFHFCLLGHF